MNISTQEAIQEIDELLKNDIYKMVNLSLFENIHNIELSSDTRKQYRFILMAYKEYINTVSKLSLDMRERFLTALRKADVIDNHKLEKEDSFLMALYLQTQRKTAIDEMINHSISNISIPFLQYIHELLMEGTSKENQDNYNFRKDNYKFVGKYSATGERIIQYFPIDYRETEIAADEFLRYYNNKENMDEDHLLIKPFVIHGLLAALQLFNDGNTRLARLFQQIKLWNMTNQVWNTNLEVPALYITRSCYPFKEQSRYLIYQLVLNANNESWNNWIKFNLRRLEDQIYYNESHLMQLEKILKK